MKKLVLVSLSLMIVPLLAAPAAAEECNRHVYNDSQYPFRIVVEYTDGLELTWEEREWLVQPYSSVEIYYWRGDIKDLALRHDGAERIYIFYHPLGTNPDKTGELLSSSWTLSWPEEILGLVSCYGVDHDGSTAWANVVLNSPARGDINILPH